MTERLYYEDSFKENFTARVLECKKVQNLYAIKLDRSAFFPGGGGQPRDYGTLNDKEVKELVEEGNSLYHVLAEPFEVSQTVEGHIDFKRRLDFMQQHSGEHILSGIVDELYGYANVGFHLSEESVTADFNGILTEAQLIKIERLANEAVFQNAPVVCNNYTKKALQKETFRAKKVFDEGARLVTIGESDCCACCGVHVQSAAQIGPIKILSAQKHRGGMRLTLKCGQRALEDYQSKLSQNVQISQLLSVPVEEVPKGVQALWNEKNALKQKLYGIEEKYFETLAHRMPSNKPVCIIEEGLAPDALRRLVGKLMMQTSMPCLILTPEEGGFKYALGQRDQVLLPLCKALNEKCAGRGGGKDICQGSLKGTFEEVKNIFEELVRV